LLLCAAAPAFAGLVERYYPGKTEAEVVSEFETGLPTFLSNRLKDPGIHVRMYTPVTKNIEVHVQLMSVDGVNTTWMTLVNYTWLKDTREYVLKPSGKDYTYKTLEIPKSEVMNWFAHTGRTPAELVGCACWFAARGEPWLANECASAVAALTADLKAEVEAWLAEKNGWTVPKDGLISIPTYAMKHKRDGSILLTAEAKAAWLKKLDTEAKEEFKNLQKLQGNDVKSKPGSRKGSPGLRLELLAKEIEGFAKAYAGTTFMDKKGAKDVQALADAVKADIEWVETEKYKAERKGIDKDWPGAAKHYEEVWRADPLNPEILYPTAQAYSRAAKLTDGARKCEDPAAAKRAAALFEELLTIYPLSLGARNYAGDAWLSVGEKSKAREFYEAVVRMTEKKDLEENEKLNRDYAEGQLKLIK
jgi:hypothetical protein